MSRSRRKTPIHGNTTASTERWDKQEWHSRFRSKERQKLHILLTKIEHEHITTHYLEVSDTWGMAKDGRHYWNKPLPHDKWQWSDVPKLIHWHKCMRK